MMIELPPAPKPGFPLPHQGLQDAALSIYRNQGYAPIDVRFVEGVEAIRLTLQGIRMGTIAASDELLERLEIEAKIEKAMEGIKPSLDRGAMDLGALLEGLPTQRTTDDATTKPKRGRPPKLRKPEPQEPK